MAVGTQFPPLFVQGLLELPCEQQNKLIERLNNHAAQTDKALRASKDEFLVMQNEYAVIAPLRLASELDYSQKCTIKEATLSDRTTSLGLRATVINNATVSLSVFNTDTQNFFEVVKQVNSIKKGIEVLFNLVKTQSQTPLKTLQDVIDRWQGSNSPDQSGMNVVFKKVDETFNGVAGISFGVFDNIRRINDSRKTALNAFATACTLCTKEELPLSNKKVQDILGKAKITADTSKVLRSFCQGLKDSDVESIFGKVGTVDHRVFSDLTEGKTRDVDNIEPLASVLVENLDLCRAVIARLVDRQYDTPPLNLSVNVLDGKGVPVLNPLTGISYEHLETLDALTLAASQPDPALGEELIKLGDLRLASLLLFDSETFDQLLKDINDVKIIGELLFGIAKKGFQIPLIRLRRLIKNTSDHVALLKTLRKVQKNLKNNKVGKIKAPIILELPFKATYKAIYLSGLSLALGSSLLVYHLCERNNIGLDDVVSPVLSAASVALNTAQSVASVASAALNTVQLGYQLITSIGSLIPQTQATPAISISPLISKVVTPLIPKAAAVPLASVVEQAKPLASTAGKVADLAFKLGETVPLASVVEQAKPLASTAGKVADLAFKLGETVPLASVAEKVVPLPKVISIPSKIASLNGSSSVMGFMVENPALSVGMALTAWGLIYQWRNCYSVLKVGAKTLADTGHAISTLPTTLSNTAGTVVKTAGSLAEGTVKTAGFVAGGAVKTAGFVAGGTVKTAGFVAGSAVKTAGFVAGGAVKTAGLAARGIVLPVVKTAELISAASNMGVAASKMGVAASKMGVSFVKDVVQPDWDQWVESLETAEELDLQSSFREKPAPEPKKPLNVVVVKEPLLEEVLEECSSEEVLPSPLALKRFKQVTLPTVFTVTRPEDPNSTAGKVHAGLETILAPVSGFFKNCNEKVQALFGSEEDTVKMGEYFRAKWGIEPTTTALLGTTMGQLEAFLNWGGRIPVICNITGAWRITIGLITGVAAGAFGLSVMTDSEDTENSLMGRLIIKQYGKHALANIVIGVFESSSWIVSIMSRLPSDLLGIRWSYEGETLSQFHITPMLKEAVGKMKEKLNAVA